MKTHQSIVNLFRMGFGISLLLWVAGTAITHSAEILPPTWVSASEGVYADRIVVTWEPWVLLAVRGTARFALVPPRPLGITTLIDAKHAIVHNKVMVIDGLVLITGSFNFTKAAEEKNAENLLIIQDKEAIRSCVECGCGSTAAAIVFENGERFLVAAVL